MPKVLVLGGDLTGSNATGALYTLPPHGKRNRRAGGRPGYPPRLATTRREGGANRPGRSCFTKGGLIGRRDAAVACLEHLNHVLATGRKTP